MCFVIFQCHAAKRKWKMEFSYVLAAIAEASETKKLPRKLRRPVKSMKNFILI